MADEPRLCANCKFLLKFNPNPASWLCQSPAVWEGPALDLVSGRLTNAQAPNCYALRGEKGACGPGGALWAAAEVK